ncbi:MAG: hypothetical protein ACYDH1_10090 [Anaerolineaceae bacterium]
MVATNKIFFTYILVFFVLLFGACQVNPIGLGYPDSTKTPSGPTEPIPSDLPVSSDTPIAPTKPGGWNSYQQQAYVDQIQINLMESFPLQVSVTVTGNLPDGCTTLEEIQALQVDDQTFEIRVFTNRMIDALCTQALVPFEENVNLDVRNLPAGTYTVKAYDLLETFTLDIDNK